MESSRYYDKVTYLQIELMKHAIGFSNRKVTGTKHRKYEPYRNYFCAGERDIPEWDFLVSLGLAAMGRKNVQGYNYYFLTGDGRLFLENVTGVKILEESNQHIRFSGVTGGSMGKSRANKQNRLKAQLKPQKNDVFKVVLVKKQGIDQIAERSKRFGGHRKDVFTPQIKWIIKS